MKKIFSILFALALVVSLGLANGTAAGAGFGGYGHPGTIIRVPDDYPTIQAALNVSEDGDTIMVAAGEYDAFLVQGKENISIISTTGATVTTANLVSIDVEPIEDAWVMAAVKDSDDINIEGINFDGTEVSGENVVGIAYVDSTGSIADLTMENIIGDEYGVGVAAIGYEGTSVVDLSGATVENSMIGIFVVGGDSTLEAHFNNIVGNTYYGAYNYGDGTMDATKNWWGYASGPYHPIANPSGIGNPVSNDVDFEPWLGASVVTETVTGYGSVDAIDEADTEVVVNGNATVTISKYLDNPGGDAPSLSVALGKWVDVYVPDTEAVTEIEIRLYYTDDEIGEIGQQYESYLRLFWWNDDENEWEQCSDSGVNTTNTNGYSGYMWATINATTTPSLANLQGEEFGGYHSPSLPPGGFCFIATAAYGTNTASQLDTLRAFRDEVLLHSSLGAKLVSFYYKTSPPLANFISQHEALRTAVRVGFVDPIVAILNWSHDLWSSSDSQ